MSNIILHHYPASPFSEKIRLLLGYKKMAYRGVTIPVIMPKDDLMALTGGYRKTPVMQIGADIYCDSALICQVIDQLNPANAIYPTASLAAANACAQWTDTLFFRVAVAMSFQPKALANNPLFQDKDAAAAFMADRAKLTEGAATMRLDFNVAEAYFLAHLEELNSQLSHSAFLFGEQPTISDFSTYHCLWFVHRNEAIADTFDPYPKILAWMATMAAFGQGELTVMDGAAAVQEAKAASPVAIAQVAADAPTFGGLSLGDEVDVMPIDYGFQPVRGKLVIANPQEIAVSRHSEQAGDLVIHFPRMGFQANKVG